ncbi:hypothetical protein KM1_247380 [Entamoeba histolytica HM-3:IMSS]|uniref:Uncharacterized protein n=1 Tax=Entamoeba histolytica HM-3:IMSS TaxID=885315 RepID=M7VZL2_ENTHI|nr:hypothetical protein KM1_247380 [Entamoeba histolytica HM-3:IMSS]
MDFRQLTRYTYRRNHSLYKYKQTKAFLSSIKNDILKCNFHTKMKLVKLNEKKTMYLTDEHPNYLISSVTGSSLQLFPTQSSNILSFIHKGTANVQLGKELKFRFGHYKNSKSYYQDSTSYKRVCRKSESHSNSKLFLFDE